MKSQGQNGPALARYKRPTRQHKAFVSAVWEAVREKVLELHTVDVNKIGEEERVKEMVEGACFHSDPEEGSEHNKCCNKTRRKGKKEENEESGKTKATAKSDRESFNFALGG